MQFDEVHELLKKLKENGIHTAIETNASHKKLIDLTEYIDFLIMDVKHFDSEKHMFWTGNDGKQTFLNLQKLCEMKKEVLVRIPVIHNVNDDAEGFVSFFKQFDCENITFEFLPYHEYGKEKWTEKYEMQDGFIKGETLKEFVNKFKENNFKIIKTGSVK